MQVKDLEWYSRDGKCSEVLAASALQRGVHVADGTEGL